MMAFALFLEPLEYVAVDAQMDGGLAAWHDDSGAFPEIFADGRGFGPLAYRLSGIRRCRRSGGPPFAIRLRKDGAPSGLVVPARSKEVSLSG